ncbi:inorganic diphosphatase [Buchnera aphidicola (Astegopteryx bambusae)]|uniref:inorganic diphosphatase n=1 Tax=Buchnera aphidicola TaxID=9 RepID=UPI0031B87DF5
MNITEIQTGRNPPNDIFTVIEISSYSTPVKYEINKNCGNIFVDRFIPVAMFYPYNYGYINKTLSEDGDCLDSLVITPYSIIPKSVIRCVPIGILKIIDESGKDNKIICIPNKKITEEYNSIKDIQDLKNNIKDKIQNFFYNYKKLEKNKWIKIIGWGNKKEAHNEISKSIKNYKKNVYKNKNKKKLKKNV